MLLPASDDAYNGSAEVVARTMKLGQKIVASVSFVLLLFFGRDGRAAERFYLSIPRA